ncbi:MAG: branched-chain amino acid ABC transporter permease [Pseudomonadota bacterium]
MNEILSFLPPLPALFGQLLIGLINGSFYALLSLGLALIFGLLNVVNFAHGAQYMLGALCTYLLLAHLGLNYWYALIITPVVVGFTGFVIERLLLRHLYRLNHLYGMLMTFGLTLIIEGVVRNLYGSSGNSYATPSALSGFWNVGFMLLPHYRVWVILVSLVICIATWLVIEKTKIGSYIRAATENSSLTRAFGIKVPLILMLTYSFGVGLAGLAGVMAAPLYQVNSSMGSELIIIVFAVVVIGGMGSILGSILSGFALGLLEGLTKVFYPEASTTVVFVVMVLILLVRPTGLFGSLIEHKTDDSAAFKSVRNVIDESKFALPIIIALSVIAPFFIYPPFLMKVLSFALFACSFNLLLGYGGMLSFGHAAFYGGGSYLLAVAMKFWGIDPFTAVILAALFAALLGIIFGYISIKRKGIYFSMITLALAQMFYFFIVQSEFSGNDEGIQAVPRGSFLGISLTNQLHMYYFVLVFFLLSYMAINRIIKSPFGYALKSIRDNEPRALSLGYSTDGYRMLAFVLSAFFAGIAGALDAMTFQIASLTNVHWSMSGHAILMTIIGGVATMTGPLVGALVVAALENYLAHLGSWVMVVQGAVFIFCVLLFRKGIVGALSDYLSKSKK